MLASSHPTRTLYNLSYTHPNNTYKKTQVICAFATAGAAPLRWVVEDPVLLREWLDLRPHKMEMKVNL